MVRQTFERSTNYYRRGALPRPRFLGCCVCVVTWSMERSCATSLPFFMVAMVHRLSPALAT